MKTHLFSPALIALTLLATGSVTASYGANAIDYSGSTYQSTPSQQGSEAEQALLTEGQLAQLLAPIALYPDSLLSHILIAASYPLEVIEAHRWRESQGSISDEKIAKRLEDQDWDASVKAIVPFETVLEQMNKDLGWLRQLGDAFLAQEQDVLDSIQALRLQAKEAGSLNAIDKIDVEYEQEKIVIVSRQPEVVYVPYYDARAVYGHWRWHHYPPAYWRHRYAFHTGYHDYGLINWHRGIHIGVGFFFSAFHWHSGYVIVNHRRGFHNHYRYHNRKRHHILYSGYSKRWHHKPYHRRNVAYRTAFVKEKYRSQYPHQRNHAVRYANKVRTGKIAHDKAIKRSAKHHNFKRTASSFKRVKGQLNQHKYQNKYTRNSAKRVPSASDKARQLDAQARQREGFKRYQMSDRKSAQNRVKFNAPQRQSTKPQTSYTSASKKHYASAHNKKKPVASINSQLRQKASGSRDKYQRVSKRNNVNATHKRAKVMNKQGNQRKSYSKSVNRSAKKSVKRQQKSYARNSRQQRKH
ncbi:DUF3300 domain-containing protein [Thalassotalea euphylliae]|uniref:DUF3300 domain-containing protein n=1 Tax=Thalassotalea euphylliae TaxID=1655234 RepID=A0A3E0TP59_9GAMM|nr:DUF3300 domain-containing protein [Thalassotalea euphylliae]REL26288.1 DUF3300 domain-containing protein [Thalassotalea euphylliae]